MAKKALIILADGFEDIEAVVPIDILRRAGIDVTVAGLKDLKVKGGRGVVVMADKRLSEARDDFDALILPGGSLGARNLAASGDVAALVKKMSDAGKVISAICAAPSTVLAPAGVLNNRSATGYPGMEKGFDKTTIYKEDDVVVDGNIITSRGVGMALPFAFAIVEKLAGAETADKVKKATLVK